MMKLSIANKLAIGFGIVVLLLAAVAGLSIISLNRSQGLIEELIDLQRVVQATNRSKAALLAERVGIGHYILTGVPGGLEKMDQARETFSEWETLIEERSGEENTKLNEIISAREKYQGQLDDAIFVYENFPDNTSEILRELGEADGFRENNLNPLIDQFYQDELESLQRKAASVRRITNLMILGGAIFGGISIIIALISAFVISRGITRSTSHLSEAADSISRGDLDVPIEVNTGDEMEDLAESIERMRTSLKAAIERLRR